MKSKLLRLTFGIQLVFCGIAVAQPTLTGSNTTPVMGEVMTATLTATFNPGAAGANQTWDFSALASTGTSTATVVSPASTPNGSSFPSANMAYSANSTSVYYTNTPTAFQYDGNQNGPTTQSYSDAEDLLRFPFTFNNSYTDQFACTYTTSATIYRNGTVHVTADGYGTLILPNGTYHNVLRVHLVELITDSFDLGGFSSTATTNTDEYLWFLPGNHSDIASTTTVTSQGSTTSSGAYRNNIKAGIEENALLSGLSLYPNPGNGAKEQLSFSLKHAGDFELSVFNSLGQQVTETQHQAGMQGQNSCTLNTGNLPKGLYFVEISLGPDQVFARKLIISE